MLNQVVVVGRLTSDPVLKELKDGKKVSNITLAVPRSYKNSEGNYDTDFLQVCLWTGVAENAVKYCQKGDLLGIKGRMMSDSEKKNSMTIVAEKVTFLTTKKDVSDESIVKNSCDDNISI